MVLALLLMACTNEPRCGPGFVPNPDGNCYEDDTDDPVLPDWEDPVAMAYDDLPECVPDDPGDEIDLIRGCASGACIGATQAEIEAALGAPDDTESGTGWRELAWWWMGLGVTFYDGGDGDYIAYRIVLYPDYAGATSDGLATEVSLRCFFDVLGDPDEVAFRDLGDGFAITSMDYPRLQVWDYVDRNGDRGHNGRADFIYLFEDL